MDTFIELFKLGFGAIFVSNLVLAQFLGLCPFVGVSKKIPSALGMGLAVTFVMTIASIVTYFAQMGLSALGMDGFLQIVVFILVIASLVQFVEMVIQKMSPALYQALGIYLPLITTNCAVLGVTQINVQKFTGESISFAYGFSASVFHGFTGGLGFMLAMLLMSAMREELDSLPVPKAIKGVPAAFILTGALALAFFGFGGMI